MKLQSAFLATAVALVSILDACSSSTPITDSGSGGSTTTKTGGSSGSGGATGSGGAGKGGSSGSGGVAGSGGAGKGGSSSSGGQAGGSSGSGGSGGGASCSATADVTPCGGVVTGTWSVTSACLKLSGQLNMQSLFSLSCATADVTGTLQVTGTWTAKADGTFVDGTTTTGTELLTLSSECKFISKAPVTCESIGTNMHGYYDTVTCTDSTDGGCTCSATVKQTGSMAFVTSDPQTIGNYTTADNTITNVQDSSLYSYCVSGNKLTLTLQGSSPTTTGTIVLQNGTGAGGTTGSGGATGKGGSSGAGGASAGGATGSGGKSGGGGTTGSGGNTASGGSTGGGGSTTIGTGPCDIYAAANMPCGAAYSMVRALSSTYKGPLYQVRSGSSAKNTGTGGTFKDIGMLDDGYANSGTQDDFCTGTTCTVSKLYDQSGNGNDLVRGSKGPTGNGDRSGEDDYEAVADKISVTAGGHKVYGLYIQKFAGYRTGSAKGTGIPLGNKDQGIYELVDGTHYGSACCWDFGSVSPDPNTYVTMNTIFFGTGFWGKGVSPGPWFGGDFEGGVWMGGTSAGTPGAPGSQTVAAVANTSNPSMTAPFSLGILHTPVGKYALRMADISTASDLTTAYDNTSPKTWGNAGGIVLGVGGDNSNNSEGTFWEGAVTNGAPTNATDLLIMKNIQAVGYKK
jgi:non-reducing end alpha-L-arabinofuranosidase